LKVDERVEISPESWNIMRGLGELVRGRKEIELIGDAMNQNDKGGMEKKVEEKGVGGAGLIMDYGTNGFSSNSFRVRTGTTCLIM
jgi:hypothetical protein